MKNRGKLDIEDRKLGIGGCFLVSWAGARLAWRLESCNSTEIDEKLVKVGDWSPESRDWGLFYGVLGADEYFQSCCKSASQGHGEG